MRYGCWAVVAAMLWIVPQANAQDADARFRADTEKLLEVTGAVKAGVQMATLISNQMFDMLKKQRPDIPARALEVITEVLDTEFSRAFEGPDGLQGTMVDLHMRHFTHQEILALLEFYDTEIGRKAIAVMPKLAQEGAAAGQEWAMANMPRIAGAIDRKLRAEGLIK